MRITTHFPVVALLFCVSLAVSAGQAVAQETIQVDPIVLQSIPGCVALTFPSTLNVKRVTDRHVLTSPPPSQGRGIAGVLQTKVADPISGSTSRDGQTHSRTDLLDPNKGGYTVDSTGLVLTKDYEVRMQATFRFCIRPRPRLDTREGRGIVLDTRVDERQISFRVGPSTNGQYMTATTSTALDTMRATFESDVSRAIAALDASVKGRLIKLTGEEPFDMTSTSTTGTPFCRCTQQCCIGTSGNGDR
jgi:hypothetical protein